MATRNAWLTAHADGHAASVGLGPRAAGGWLSATLTLRTADGGISDPVELTAGGVWHGTDSQTDGRADAPAAAHAYIKLPGSLRVYTEPRADGGIDLHIVQRDSYRNANGGR